MLLDNAGYSGTNSPQDVSLQFNQRLYKILGRGHLSLRQPLAPGAYSTRFCSAARSDLELEEASKFSALSRASVGPPRATRRAADPY